MTCINSFLLIWDAAVMNMTNPHPEPVNGQITFTSEVGGVVVNMRVELPHTLIMFTDDWTAVSNDKTRDVTLTGNTGAFNALAVLAALIDPPRPEW